MPGLLVELGNVVICLHSLRELKNSGSVVVCTIGTAARRYHMMTRRMAILNCLAAIGSILVGGPAFAAPSRAMRLLDTDNDGTVDLRGQEGGLYAVRQARP